MGKLTLEERQKIKDVINVRGWKLQKVAEVLGVSRGHFSNMLVRRSLQGRYAMKLHEILGYDKEVTFLENHYRGLPQPGHQEQTGEYALVPMLDIDSAWMRLYEAYTSSLRKTFVQQSTEKKKQIVGELERMIESYK